MVSDSICQTIKSLSGLALGIPPVSILECIRRVSNLASNPDPLSLSSVRAQALLLLFLSLIYHSLVSWCAILFSLFVCSLFFYSWACLLTCTCACVYLVPCHTLVVTSWCVAVVMAISPLCREESLATPSSLFQLGGCNKTGGLWDGTHKGAHMYMYCYVHVMLHICACTCVYHSYSNCA